MQERIQATIPKDHPWHLPEIEAKAKAFGMDKTEFVIKSVELMMNFSVYFYELLQKQSAKHKVPDWLYIQNVVIKKLASDAAYYEVFNKGRVTGEFLNIDRGEEIETVTDDVLYEVLKSIFVDNYRKFQKPQDETNLNEVSQFVSKLNEPVEE